ncbi:MAG: ATP-dependent DNA helicase PcrA [Ruminococcaceae bacterium]|nr:ATP-dependent DNA helicase PcrA [Oscillospiraceae bacterium]
MSQLGERYNSAKKTILEREFAHLNEPQRKAVFTAEGPLLILAGAGSGKTTVLINRTAYLLKYGNAYFSKRLPAGLSESDVQFLEEAARAEKLPEGEDAQRVRSLLADYPPHPWQVMAITFTNKAAAELKHRLEVMLGEAEGNEVWAMTFHASCVRMLRRDADRIGFTSKFAIYDTDDQKRIIKQIMTELDIDEKAVAIRSVQSEISRAKNHMLTPEEYEAEADFDYAHKQIAKVYDAYCTRLRSMDAMDFDDLLIYTVRLLEDHDDVREYYRRRFRYIMVDEYQDTNQVQYKLVSLLTNDNRNLCVVGDDDQSIYRFRGATIENILSFDRTYADASVIRLEQNYRSTQRILDAANSVIANNLGRHAKKLWTANGEGAPIILYNSDSERSEAEYITQRVIEHVQGGGRYSDCAVLYRVAAMSSVIESHLMHSSVPYRVVAGRKFYDRKEIRDAIAYLCVIENPADIVRLTRIINEPKRGIGERTMQLATEIAQGLGITLFEVLGTADQYAVLSKSASKLIAFHSMISELSEASVDPEVSLSDLLRMLLDKSGYRHWLLMNDNKAEERLQNLSELASAMERYQQDAGDDASLGGFLEEVALATDIDSYDENADCVSLMTLHAAKGLEFPVVFIPGAEEGIFPGMQAMASPEEIEEDRRLAYVGITRAKEKLYIIHANYRMLYGHTVRNRVSRYVEEIDQSLLDKRGGERPKQSQSIEPRSRSWAQRFNDATSTATAVKTGSKTGGAGSAGGKFAVGDTVKHKIFGEGTVLSASAMGADTLLEVDFAKAGVKKLMANYAGLVRV